MGVTGRNFNRIFNENDSGMALLHLSGSEEKLNILSLFAKRDLEAKSVVTPKP
jgi:hypothetical protein